MAGRLPVSVAAFELLPATAEARRALRCVFHAEVKFDFSSPRHVLLITFCCLTFYCDLANTGDGVQDFITVFGEPEEFLNQRVVHQRQPSVVASDSFVFVVIDGGVVGRNRRRRTSGKTQGVISRQGGPVAGS